MGKRKRQTHLTFEPLVASGGISNSNSDSRKSKSSNRGNGGQARQVAGGGHSDDDPFQEGNNDDESNNNKNNDDALTSPQPTPRKESNFAPANVRYSQHAVRVRTKPRLLVSDKNDRFDKARKKERRLEQSRIKSKAEYAAFMPKPLGSTQRSRVVMSDDSSDDSSAVEVVATTTTADGSGADDDHDHGSESSGIATDSKPASTSLDSKTVPQIVVVDEDEDSDDMPLPRSASKALRSSQSVSTRMGKTAIRDDTDDEDDEPILAPSSAARRRRTVTIKLDDSDEEKDKEDEDEDISLVKRRRIGSQSTPRAVTSIDSDDDGNDGQSSSTSKRSARKGRLVRSSQQVPSSPTKRFKGHRTEKQKKMELLRRRRAGEKITTLTDSDDGSNEDDEDAVTTKRGMYDTDSDDELQALKEFDDDEEEDQVQQDEPQPESSKRSRKDKKKLKGSPRKSQKARESEGSEDLDDFVVDDDDTPLGVPVDIPLEFTKEAHLPLKDQFPYVVEWLVHNKIDPAFKRQDPIYINAWRKLDDEYRGLANSKFASSAWKSDFFRSLKGRPKIDAYGVGVDGVAYDNCEACGRSGHPATFKIVFWGNPYNKGTLDDIESDSDSESSDKDEEEEEEETDTRSVDSQGMPLAPETKQWHVGAVCCSNAETAHELLHWKHHLKEYVEEKLDDEGWNKPKKIAEREKLKAKKRRRLADGIVDDWQERKIITSLYNDFKRTLEEARNKATTGSRGGGRNWR